MIKTYNNQNETNTLSTLIKNGAFLVDVRTPAEFASGSVQGAINIPVDHVLDALSQFENKESIIVFCLSGARSGYAKDLLKQHGFSNVVNGGSWQNVYFAINS